MTSLNIPRLVRKFLTLLSLICLSCELVEVNSDKLNSVNATSSEQRIHDITPVSCVTCHSYPPKTGSHNLHLFTDSITLSPFNTNGQITCLDCHSLSIQHVETINTNLFGEISAIIPNLSHLTYDEEFDEIQDFLKQYYDQDIIPSFKTTTYHNNGTLEVTFPLTNLEEASDEARYDPKNNTCSATLCHDQKEWY